MFTTQKIRYGLYPMLLLTVIAAVTVSIRMRWNYQLTLVLVERLFPLDGRWSMTRVSFLRDLRYILLDAPTIALTKAAFGLWAIHYAAAHGRLLNASPVWLEASLFLLVFEFLQYWFHRLSHRARGPIGQFLWRVHVAHHLPDKVYVIMHAVFHPVNALITASIIQLPFILLGVSPEAVLIGTMMIDLQSLVSHFNVDVRAGWLNYVFIGTETHSYHHSADPKEAVNFGNTLAIWDIVFGTFCYRPGIVPERLGVDTPSAYPPSERLFDVIAFPFRRVATADGKRAATGEIA
jgi:sterol desaturase/sphingolipid hydroxylase (fatty acid hydroxylase superfamily)